MSITLREYMEADICIIELGGAISLGDPEGMRNIRTTIDENIAKGNKKIILDLSKVDHLDSSGIAEIVYAYTRLVNHGGNIALLQPNSRVADVFKLTKLSSIFYITDDKADAIRQLSKS